MGKRRGHISREKVRGLGRPRNEPLEQSSRNSSMTVFVSAAMAKRAVASRRGSMANERGKKRQHRNRELIEEWSRMRKWDRNMLRGSGRKHKS